MKLVDRIRGVSIIEPEERKELREKATKNKEAADRAAKNLTDLMRAMLEANHKKQHG